MTRFSDAALLKGDFAHMAAEFRAGQRVAPRKKDWRKVACDNAAEETAQEVAKHIFALQQSVDEKSERLDIMTFSAAGPMRVAGVVPGEGDILRIEGVLENGEPVAQVIHASQLALTFTKRPLAADEPDDDGLQIGFVIFDELRKRQKRRAKKLRRLSLKTSRIIKPKQKKQTKSAATKASPKKADT